MRTPSSRRRRLAIAAAVIIFAAITGWLIFSSDPSDALTISYEGSEPGHSSSVGFWVTNTTHVPVYPFLVCVQSNQNGDWNTLYETQLPFLPDTNWPQVYDSPMKLAPGEHQKILVARPSNGVWRAALTYSFEVNGFRALSTKVRLAVTARDLRFLRLQGNPWSVHTNFSAPITNALPKS